MPAKGSAGGSASDRRRWALPPSLPPSLRAPYALNAYTLHDGCANAENYGGGGGGGNGCVALSLLPVSNVRPQTRFFEEK